MDPILRYLLSQVIRLCPRALRAWFWQKLSDSRLTIRGVRLPSALGLFIKYSRTPYEATVLPYVAARTSIPVPTVIDSVQIQEKLFALVITEMPGYDLDATFREMTDAQTAHVARQLSGLLAQIRALPHPQAPQVCGLDGGPIYDNRLSYDMYPWGPFASVPEFHEYMVKRSDLRFDNCEDPEAVLAVLRQSHSKPHRVCFTHGDFHPGNILVDDDFNVTAILDWEMAAWMPEYWYVLRDLCSYEISDFRNRFVLLQGVYEVCLATPL
ncbi:kinase-like domain-containing protein [Schizophyllum fasciatum]